MFRSTSPNTRRYGGNRGRVIHEDSEPPHSLDPPAISLASGALIGSEASATRKEARLARSCMHSMAAAFTGCGRFHLDIGLCTNVGHRSSAPMNAGIGGICDCPRVGRTNGFRSPRSPLESTPEIPRSGVREENGGDHHQTIAADRRECRQC